MTLAYKTNITIKKCFEVIGTIIHYDPMVAENMLSYEDALNSLVVFLDSIDKIDFEDSIIEVYSVLVERSKNFTKSMAGLVEYFPRILAKNEFNVEVVFDFLLYSFQWGGTALTYDHEKTLRLAIDILLRCLENFIQSTATPGLAYEQFAKTCFLIQFFIQKFSQNEIESDVEKIGNATCKIYYHMKIHENNGKGIGYSPK